MNKKKLPKVIVPSATVTSGAGALGSATTLNAAAPVPPAYSRDPQLKPEATTAKKPAGSEEAGTEVSVVSTEMSPAQRRASAAKLVERFSLWSGAAGIIPVPLLDLAAVGGVQIQMLRRISQIYGVPFSASRGKALIASLAGSMIPASSGMGASSLLKALPIVGTAVSALAMPVLSAGATYAIGMVFIEHFSTGGTLLDFHAPDYRAFAKAQRNLWASRRAPK